MYTLARRCAAIIFNNIYSTIYFILSDDLRKKEKSLFGLAVTKKMLVGSLPLTTVHRHPIWFEYLWCHTYTRLLLNRMLMRFFRNFSSSEPTQKKLFAISSRALAVRHIRPKLRTILWRFVCCYCSGCYYFVFIFQREINSSSVTLYTALRNRVMYRRRGKKSSSSLWMIYFLFLLVTLCSHIWNIFHRIFSRCTKIAQRIPTLNSTHSDLSLSRSTRL